VLLTPTTSPSFFFFFISLRIFWVRSTISGVRSLAFCKVNSRSNRDDSSISTTSPFCLFLLIWFSTSSYNLFKSFPSFLLPLNIFISNRDYSDISTTSPFFFFIFILPINILFKSISSYFYSSFFYSPNSPLKTGIVPNFSPIFLPFLPNSIPSYSFCWFYF